MIIIPSKKVPTGKSQNKTLARIANNYCFVNTRKNKIIDRNYGCNCEYCLKYQYYNCTQIDTCGSWKSSHLIPNTNSHQIFHIILLEI